MTLKNKINTDYLTAFKEKDTLKKNLLWEIKTEIVLLEKTKEVSDDDIINIISKIIKKVQATIDTCPETHKEILDKAIMEMSILKEYLPQQLSEAEIKDIIYSQLYWKNMWEVMSFFKTNYNGKVDMSLVSKLFREQLNSWHELKS